MNIPHIDTSFINTSFIHQATPAAQILGGALALFFGRKLFWLFVGIIGFMASLESGRQIASAQPEGIILLIALAAGILGAILAIVLERLAIAIAGGIAGGMLAVHLAEILKLSNGSDQWIVFLVGAVIAAIFVSLLFDWALIILSSLTGAVMISDALTLPQTTRLIIAAVLFVIGFLVQAQLHRSLRHRTTVPVT